MTTFLTAEENQKRQHKADRLATVVYLLQALHLLFGITAVIAMLINHTNGKAVEGTIAASHFKWQIVTFWISLLAYGLAFYMWVKTGHWQWVAVVFFFVSLRVIRGWWQLVARQDIGNFW